MKVLALLAALFLLLAGAAGAQVFMGGQGNLVTTVKVAKPGPVSITPLVATVFDTITAGTSIATLSVTMSDGSPFKGSLSVNDPSGLVKFQGTSNVLVAAANFTPGADGVHSNITVTANQNGISHPSSFVLTVQAQPALITSMVQAENYDTGGEGVAFHAANPSVGIAFNHYNDLLNFGASPATTASINVGTSNLVVVSLEFAGCTNPSATFAGQAMTLPAGGITTTSQGGNNPEAFFYLIAPSTTSGPVAVTCPGATFLYVQEADYTDSGSQPVFKGAANTVNNTTSTVYASTFNNPFGPDMIMLAAQNIGGGGGGTGHCAGGVGATQRGCNNFSSGALFDSGSTQPAGNYSMTTTIPDDANGGPFSNSKQTHVFMSFNAGGPPPSPHIASVTASPGPFTVPFNTTSNPLETLAVSCDIGSCSGSVMSLPTTAANGCTAANIADNGLFTISGTSLNAKAQIATARTYNVGVQVDLTGATNTPQCYALALVGSSVSNNVALDNTIFTGTQPDTPNGITWIGDITGCTGASDCILGGTDGGSFMVLAAGSGLNGSGVCAAPNTGFGCPAGWDNSAGGGPRKGAMLFTKGAVPGKTSGNGGFDITINGTPFHLGDPPAPSVAGATVISPGANVQNAINSAPGTVFLNCGNYSGGFNANGHNIVSATGQNHINGQTCRAVINGGTVDISGATVYGLDLEGCPHPCITGSNGTLTNTIVNHGAYSGEWYCQGGGVLFNWDSFITADGGDNNCGGGLPFVMDHVFIYDCGGDCNGGVYLAPGLFSMTNSFCDVRNITGRLMNNLGSCIEDGWDNGNQSTFTNNFTINAGSDSTIAACNAGGSCGGYAWSLISGPTTHPVLPLTFRYNYTGGWRTILEWEATSSTGSSVQYNYFDNSNMNTGPVVFSFAGTFGPFTPGDGGTNSHLGPNKEIPNVADNQEGTCDPKVNCGLIYGGTDQINVGIPGVPAAGAGP